MTDDLVKTLDLCIDRLNNGESLEACLKDYPEHAAELEALLNAALFTRTAFEYTPSVDAKRLARQRFYDAAEKTNRAHSWFKRPWAWGMLAAALAVMVIGFFVFRFSTTPDLQSAPAVTVLQPASNGNFVFLVSDDVNAIADFENLFVTIDKVSLHESDNDDQLAEFVPETKTFDLSLLPGDQTQELWRGNVPEGIYNKVVIEVSEVRGVLKDTGETLYIKLPSNKLQLSRTFRVNLESVTSFTYDLTVVKAGNDKQAKYILKPQIGESGVTTQPVNVPPGQDSTKVRGKSGK